MRLWCTVFICIAGGFLSLSAPHSQTVQALEPARFPVCLRRECHAEPASSSGIKEEPVGNADSRAPPRLPGSESALSVNPPPPRFLSTSQHEKYYS